MTAVTAARWDFEWERGGGWWIRLGRRTRSGEVLPLAAPCALEVRRVDDPSTVPAVLVLSGEVATDGAYVDLQASREQIEGLPGERYEYRVLATDAVRVLPLVLLRGLTAIRDRVGDD